MKTYQIEVTISGNYNCAKFYKKFAKNNRIININHIEFENTDEQHISGFFSEFFKCDEKKLLVFVSNYIKKNNLVGECFDVCNALDNEDKLKLTEDDFNFYSKK